VLVPTVSSLHERDSKSIPALYRESYRLIFFLAIPTFALLVVLSPLVSRIWIGHYEPLFVRFVALLAAGWIVNILSNPAYVMDLGTGALRWVTIGCTLTAVLNLTLGFVAGKLWGGTAVVAVSACSLMFGYFIITISYHIENRVPYRELLPKESVGIVLSSLCGVLIFLPLLQSSVESAFIYVRVAMTIAILGVVIFVPMWSHPLRKRLVRWLFARAA
jgi:O-antigen/teichoic acid export membrane protein